MSGPEERLTYVFEGFRLDAQHRVLARANGESVPLAPKVFDTLLYFVERPGQLLGKGELLEAIWPNVIVEENNLNQSISTLRRTLGEHPTDHRFIVTVPGQGYRFVASVNTPATEASAAKIEAGPPGLDDPATVPGRNRELGFRSYATALSVTAIAVGVALAGAWMLNPAAPNEASAVPTILRLELNVSPGRRLSGGEPVEMQQRPTRQSFTLSPDGRYLVYAASDGKTTRLYRRPMDQEQATLLPGTEGASQPFFSADGRSVGFVVGSEIRRVPIEGGEARTLALAGPMALEEGAPASWTEDDTILVTAKDGGIYELPANGGSLVRLTRDVEEGKHLYPQMLPGRRAVLFNVATSVVPSEWKIVIETLDGAERRVVVEGGSHPRYISTGHIVFARRGTLVAVPFDLNRLQATGAQVVVLEDVMHGEGGGRTRDNLGAAQFAVAENGTLAYVRGGTYPALVRSLLWLDRNGKAEPLPLPPAMYLWPRFSPDGTRLSYAIGNFGDVQLWVHDIALGISTPLTHAGHNAEPVWSPDGKRLVFDRLTGAELLELYSTPADRSGAPERIRDGFRGEPSSWSVDDVLAFVSEGQPVRSIWTLRMDGSSKPEPFTPTNAVSLWPDFSPDGKWLAYATRETDRFEVFVQPFPSGTPVKVSADGGRAPLWSRNGRELFYMTLADGTNRPQVMVVDIVTEPTLKRSRPRFLFEVPSFVTSPNRNYDIDPNGDRFVFPSTPVEIEPQPVTRINVVINWNEELERLAPTGRRSGAQR